ncbi:MAG: DUF1707 and DUF4870 domain-containing protein [Propionibacterium sp.]|mgnify:FL=1|jgi:uncharacterized Tic20 family protein|nr:DUF1707 and DUF4870 domain-containing protein [Brooklawnia sp. SH051]NLI85641.1 DUF1707 and DUF4870 domain-containing protein [Propionibacterium sp.]
MTYDQWPLLNNNEPTASATGPQITPDDPINETQRGDAERILHQAYRDGRISATDFEARFTRAMNAQRLGQLYTAIENIPAPVKQSLVAVNQQYRAYTGQRPNVGVPVIPGSDSGVAMLAHLSGLVTWIIGPAIIYGSSRPGTVLRREAAKAFNYQLVAAGVFIAGAIVFGVVGAGGLVTFLWLGWLGLTIAGAVKAARGEDWVNPLSKAVKIRPLPTDGR